MCDKIIAAIKNIQLETKNSDLSKTCQEVVETLKKNYTQLEDVITKLSQYILNIEDAVLFKKYLSNFLLVLVSKQIPLRSVFSNSNYDHCNDLEKTHHLEYSVILALMSDHPDILQYALKYFQINTVPPYEVFIHHEDSYNVAPKKRRLLDCRQKITDNQIVTCCHSLLSKLPNELASKWDWTKFVTNFSNHENSDVRWMVKECMAIITNMTEAQSKILASNLGLNQEDILKNIPRTKEVLIIDGNINELDLKESGVVNVDGILLPVFDKNNVQSGNLVPVKSTIDSLRSLALAVASGKALSLMGPVGSGKTSLVEYLAAITGRKGIAFKKVQLGDQTDSRMLLGSHQCTDVPGEFLWSPGVLTEAVQNGHWLLLEDIDCAALDVASTLSSLLERNTLCVPGYRDALPVTPGFQLFVTQRTVVTNYGYQKKMSSSSTLLQKHLTQINVEPLARSELAEIIQNQYPTLATISSKMIEVFMMFSVGSHDSSLQTADVGEKFTNVNILRGSRLISTRDLMKWCARAVVGFNVASPESALKVLQDALDIFTCSISSPEYRLELSKKVGTCLGIVETKSEFYCKHYKPNVSLHPNSLEVGRSKVPRIEKSLEMIDFESKEVVFSFTRQSACLLEKIACCVTSNEPVLLVGETGTGKTSSIQYLSKQTGHKLVVINMNQQSDSADLLGGYKPVDLKFVIRPIKSEYIEMFKGFFNTDKNTKFIGHIETCYETENWTALLTLMKKSHKAAINRLINEETEDKLKIWLAFGRKLSKLEQQIKAASRLSFAFIEGSLVKAMQQGYWVLLDEINLASAEILECLAGLLEDKNESIELLEKGDKVPIKRHPDFTLFACMNPATDVGKKDLPVGLRNRFTEIFIDELTERNDLMLLIGDYLYHMNLGGVILEAIYHFYATIRKEAKLNLVDGSGNAPHYSLRTLCRALTAAAKAKCGTVARSLYEAFCLSFLTQLDRSSHPKVESMIAKAVLGKKNVNSVLKQLIPEPNVKGQQFLLFEGHWIPQGNLDINIPEGYILTQTVRKNLRDIARIISLGRLPVLLQGDTSVGKTSLITYIAKASGNYCVRINNHEHTDLQEYIGSYATDSKGNLVFKEGVLVEAMRKGYWIILDELNLAPSDVLEALNRVLDDNRELFIPETQQLVKADPNFMLFATQNPPGLYGGRKMLSRAFRNRFVELHFDEIPRQELETILHQRCHIPPTYCKKMIEVMAELQVRRRGSAAVQGKDGFITLRDLFRWGQRYKHASKDVLTTEKFYDWDQHIADEGYLILAGRVRQTDERNIIEDVIEKHIKRKVNPDNLFSVHSNTSLVTKPILETILNNQLSEFAHIAWTYNMRRLAVLIAKAFTFNEPVLVVGETGCGKTTICQILAALSHRQLLSVNCHMHTESSDFLGGLRPVRQYKNDGKLFEWVDGPLVKCMENGHLFLADEISLADDSVLERLNSLLESERQLVLSERGMEDNSDIVVITAVQNFHFIGTMNPGGDFGKKELSPALRNRFTEIWCDHVSSREDLLKVLEKSVSRGIALGNQEDGTSGIGNRIIDFTDWLKSSEVTNKFPFSIRDLLSWVQFINTTVSKGLLDVPEAYVHGACMTFLDSFGTTLTGHINTETLVHLHQNAIQLLLTQIKIFGNEYADSLRNILINKNLKLEAECDSAKFGIKPFFIECGPGNLEEKQSFTFTAPTTGSNTLRLLRGLQLNKAILLEGNPGVGKTSLVTALAKSSGHKVVRINLSDQTDVTDLFGTDLPTEDGSFVFKEGAFLNALQNGDWILLDELNLAPQPVLEGLNACLDHRGEIFVPELGKTFKVRHQTKLFACQNPLKQGGARRGLPVSFLNRFTQVYIDTLTKDDLIFIVKAQYSQLPSDILHKIVEFNCKIAHEVTEIQSWGHSGSPWEMNLRDIQRWCEALLVDSKCGNTVNPGKYVDMLYINRMRTEEDKEHMTQIYDAIFYPEYPRSDNNPQILVSEENIIIGDVTLQRNTELSFKCRRSVETNLIILRNQLSTLKALAQNVEMNWLSIIVGPTATGKSSIVEVLADLTGNDLHVVPVTSAMDVSDLLGGFEQVDYNRNLESLYDEIETITIQIVRNVWIDQELKRWRHNTLLSHLYQYKYFQDNCLDKIPTKDDIKKFSEKLQFLLDHCKNLLDCATSCNLSTQSIEKVTNDVIKLSNKLSTVSSVNAGGKFEWVDSLLIKSLVDGSWLLLDNVNLTSAAVLDRLNGLLEPNGVLNIAERGGISEIKPHPNFRVFFTMDPKFGEISRAMRNRGVELYLLRSDDLDLGLSETMNYMDLIALLSSCGLPNEYHDICIRCHESMTAFIQGLERPTVSHLLQAAHLTWQQLIRGVSSSTALMSSFTDVYIKPRSGSDFTSPVIMSLAETKNSMLRALEFELGTEEFQPFVTNNISHTLTVKGLSSNASYVIAKQIVYLVIKQTVNSEMSEENAIQSLFCMLTSYQKCPASLLEMCHHILKEEIKLNKANKIKLLTSELNEQAFEFIQNSTHKQGAKRFYPEAYQLEPEIISNINAEFVLLYIELKNIVLNSFLADSGFSVINYSNAVCDGKLSDDFTEFPILKNCNIYIKLMDCYIKNMIKFASTQLDDDLLCLIVQLLNWRDRFIKACSLSIFERSKNQRAPILKEEIIPLLNVHRKWIQKYLFGELFKFSRNQDYLKKFCDELKLLKLDSKLDTSKIAKVSKKMRKCYGQPKLYQNQIEYDLSTARAELYNRMHIDMSEPIDRQLFKTSENPECLSDVNLAFDVPEKDSVRVVENKFEKVATNTTDDFKQRRNITLLPVNLYILQRIINILQPYLFEIVNKIAVEEPNFTNDLTRTNCNTVLISLIQTANVVKGFPPALLDQLKIIQKFWEGSFDIVYQRISSLPVVFWTELYNFLASSPVTYPKPFINQNSLLNSEEVGETIPANTKRMSFNMPLMAYYLQTLTTFIDKSTSRSVSSYKEISLQDRVEYSTQLEIIMKTLWKNVGTVDSTTALQLRSNADFELQKYTQLLKYLHHIITEQDITSGDEASHAAIVQTVQIYFRDVTQFHNLFTKASEVYNTLSTIVLESFNDTSITKVKVLTSELRLLTSFILLRINAEISPMDHVEKYRLKVQYIKEDVDMFNKFLGAYYVHGVISGTINENRNIEKASQVTADFYKEGTENQKALKKVHPYCKVLMELKEKTAQKVQKYASGNTFRPKEPSYGNFVKDCKHFTKSVIAEKSITTISTNLISIAHKLYELIETKTLDKIAIQNAHTVLKETSSWTHSVKAFYKKLDSAYSVAFPDLAKPLQSSLSQIVYSVLSMTDLIRELLMKLEQGPGFEDFLTSLLEYPNAIPSRAAKAIHLNRFISTNFMQILNRNMSVANGDTFHADVECFEVLKMNLSELSMSCMASDRIDQSTINAMLTTLNALVNAWDKQRQDIEKKQQDEEALYVTKSKCEDEDEESTAHGEIMEMFPSYSESDFGEFKPPTLEQKKIKPPIEKPNHLITSDDVSLIYKWHSNFVRNLTRAEWLTGPKKLVGNDVLSPLLLRYQTFSTVVQGAWEALGANFEGQMSPSFLVLISHIKSQVDGSDTSTQKLDFYRSPWVAETSDCVPLLHKVKDSTNELLEQWPDFPTLKDIIIIVDRVLSFPITSPVSRFLTGLELLRDKIEEWNKNAHKGNNMIDVSLAVGQQIITWRKLEMSHWKECLNNLYQRKQSEAHKYWFYMYAVVNSFLNPNSEESVTSSRVVSVLKEFMETSSLAEYDIRLDIVHVYHCHLVHLERSERRDELISILWNTYNYYVQFSPQVSAQIKEKRAPIEKKLRDFVKICTWDRDLSYWSVKDTVEKAHKALHKHTKEFEKVLKESVAGCLVDNTGEVGADHVGIWDRPKRATGANAPTGGAYMIDPQLYIVLARSIKKYIDQTEQPSALIPEGGLLSKIPNLLNKAKTLCKDTITNTGYPSLVQGLDDFVTLVIETSAHLGSLEVDSTAAKDKQTSQAKNFVQQKRKALADLFKYLTKMGLNYRTGLVILSASEELYDFAIPPVDLSSAISYLKSRRCDPNLTLLWSGCEKYFQKNIARHKLFSTSLQTPHSDLGMQNIERCKGFAAQLLKITNSQKKSIAKYTRHVCELRIVTTNLTNALDIDITDKKILTLSEKVDILVECYAHTSILLDQFCIVLKSIPEITMNTEFVPEFDVVLSDSPLTRCFLNNDEWRELYKKVKAIIAIVDKQKASLYKLSNSIPKQLGNVSNLPNISQNHIDVTNDAKINLKIIIEKSEAFSQEYQFKFRSKIVEDFVPNHPVLRCIEHLIQHLNDTIQELNTLDKAVVQEMCDISSDTIIAQTEDIVATTLLIIQSLYKRHLPTDKCTNDIDVLNAIDEIIEEGNNEKEESKEILEDKHLNELLQDKLLVDSKMLQLDILISKIRSLLVNYVHFIAINSETEAMKNAVMRLIPILEQTVLFVHYFLSQNVAVHRVSCKMLSVLLKIFSDLATKGFCKPSDLDIEEGEGDGGPGKLSSGMGLGEGEGQKDVSERIENQDQLDDAHRPGEEKNQEDRDCKEEEKGVNMTDDFDSHLQDIEQKEGEESDQDNENDDADKQMGETDNAAEKLDQQIWGSEDEEDMEEDPSKKEKEEHGKGESTGEKEMAAKEQEQGQDDGTEGKEKEKKKDINEMKEPEVDDDHIDPYHGNHPQLPEPEDFELSENMDIDGEGDDEKDGETETENPFEINTLPEVLEEEQPEEKEGKDSKNGLEISSDEEDGEVNKDANEEQKTENVDQNEENEINKELDENEDDALTEEDDSKGQLDNDNPETENVPPESQEENEPKDQDLPKNPDSIDEEETQEKQHEANPQANPSNDDPTAENKAENAEMEKGTNDNVETNSEQAKDEDAAPFEQAQEQVGEDIQSTGRSELDKSDKGHRGNKDASRAETSKDKEKKQFENKPGLTDQERSLGEVNEKKHRKAKTLNIEKEDAEHEGVDGETSEDKEADAYQHVKQAKEDSLQVVDAATKEQAEQQPTLQQDDSEDTEELKYEDEVAMDVDDDNIEVEKSENLKSEKIKDGPDKDQDKTSNKKEGGEDGSGETGIEVEGDAVLTETVPRGSDTTYHTKLEMSSQQVEDITMEQYLSLRQWLESGAVRGSAASTAAWRSVWNECGGAARSLCERLRLVLEPTGRSRRAGDFRTGRAINMRRVIPYIASHFRKDRIWLRRTKPAKREYKIAIAIDDSSSMADNRSKELAFESLALVSQALNLLESGDLAVLSFGENPNLLHPFTEQFSEHSGSKILEQLRFDQAKTKIAQLLDFCTVMFDQHSIRSDTLNAKLLVVVSDGRGIFSEGETRVLQAVRRARQQGIFLVYVIIDNPDNKDSIMDIRRPILNPVTNTLSGFIPYLDTFPFPFYLILRDMNALPTVLGDALRQWFELAANTSS